MSQIENDADPLMSLDKNIKETEEEKHEGEKHPEEQESEQGTAHGEKSNTYLDDLKKAIDEQTSPEGKLQVVIQFMETSLAQNKTPHFKSFWQARELCFGLFKENIPPPIRSTLWSKYSELSKEARRLKEILDEQGAFAAEQIEIAIKALEADIESPSLSPQSENVQSIVYGSQFLEGCARDYDDLQHELDHLNSQASRINALRKELMKTEIRARKKNQFFQRLSSAGDKVFPRRKDLIQQISKQFTDDVEAFIDEHFTNPRSQAPFYFLREEIKALQSIAKRLTLNTHTFTQTRLRLSEYWDKIKQLEQERKKEQAQQRALYHEQMEALNQKIATVSTEAQAEKISPSEAIRKLDDIVGSLRSLGLGREEVKSIRELVQEAKKPLHEILDREVQARQEQEHEKVRARQQKLEELRQETNQLIQRASSETAEQLTSKRDELLEKIQNGPLTKLEKQDLERSLKPLRDLIADKKEESLMTLSEDDRQAMKQLKEVLNQRKQRRQEVRDQIETLRRAGVTSGFDFEQAMTYQAQINEEKERLEKMNQGIDEIERKIRELGKKV